MIHACDLLMPVLGDLEKEFTRELDELDKTRDQPDCVHSADETIDTDAKTPPVDYGSVLNSENSIEEKIYEFSENFLQIRGSNVKKAERLFRESIGSIRRVHHIMHALKTSGSQIPLRKILLFSPFWIRDPLTWNDFFNKTMLEHLFIKYPVAEPLYSEWTKPIKSTDFKWIFWFLVLGQGGSLKKASKLFGWNIYSKFQHHYLKINDSEPHSLACMRAEINRMGGSNKHWRLIRWNPAYIIDPTDQTIDRNYIRYWYQTVGWVIRNFDKMTEEEGAAALEWAFHEYSEAEQSGETFSWKGRTARNVIRRSKQYFLERDLKGKEAYWKAHDMDWRYQDRFGRVWTINEITSGEELYKEGRILKHCAGLRFSNCILNLTAIFSMKCNRERRATIEIKVPQKRFLQAAGFKNRPLDKAERFILSTWLQQYSIKNNPFQASAVQPQILSQVQNDRFRPPFPGNGKRSNFLHDFAICGDIKNLQNMLDEGAPINRENKTGETALGVAVSHRKKRAVLFLIEAGADVNHRSFNDRDILAAAIDIQDVQIVRILVQGGAKIKPFHIYLAASLKRPVILNLFLRSGADIRMESGMGKTPLAIAIQKKDISAITRLKKLGDGIDPYSYFEALSSPDDEVREALNEFI